MFQGIKKFKNQKDKKGFSFLEMIIAMAIFSLAIAAAVAAFASVVNTQKKTREIQRNVESAGTSIELMSKTIRMSSQTATYHAGKEIRLYNNSQAKCISYRFNAGNGNLEISEMSSSTGGTDCPNTGTYPASSYSTLIPEVSGLFSVTQTRSSSPKRMGKATILVNIGQNHLQSTVSFMNYSSIL